MGTRCCKVFFLNYSKKKSDEDTLVPSPWGKREKNVCFVQDFPRDRTFVSGRDPAGSRYPGIPRDGIRRGILSTGRYRTGLNHHGIERENLEGIEISRDCTGRDFTGQKNTVLHGTGLRYHGILRDEKSAVLHGTGLRCHGMALCSCQDRGCSLCVCRPWKSGAHVVYWLDGVSHRGVHFESFLVAPNYFIKNEKKNFWKWSFFIC